MGFDNNFIQLHKKVTRDNYKAVKQSLQTILDQFEQTSYLDLIVLKLLQSWEIEEGSYPSFKNNILLRIRKCIREARKYENSKLHLSPTLMKGIDYIYQNLMDKSMTDEFYRKKKPMKLIRLARLLVRFRLQLIRLRT